MTYVRRTLWLLLSTLLALAAIFALGVLWPEEDLDAVRTPGPVAIIGVSVVDVRSGTAVAGKTVLVEQGRIRAVGSAVALPADVRRIATWPRT